MFVCVICHFDAELDDVVFDRGDGRCVCLRCYERETRTERRVSKAVVRDAKDASSGTP